MEVVRRALATIHKQLGQLSPVHRLLIAALAVIAGLTLVIVAQVSGKTSLVELLPGAAPADLARARTHLTSVGIDVRDRGGRLLVPASQQRAAFAQLSEARALPADTSILFRNIIEKQSWQMSRQQNDQLYTIALQNELARAIADWRGIKSATVLLDAPEPLGLGAAVRTPSASATVATDTGAPLEQATVDAIAHFIAGAKSGMDVRRIRVIDAGTGRQRSSTRDDQAIPTTYLDHAARVENQTREKLLDLLAYIPGVIVAVTAQVDVTRVDATVKRFLDPGQGTVSLPRKESTQETSQADSVSPAEPGVRSNQAADINRSASARGSRTSDNTSETEFENLPGSRTEVITDPRGMPTLLAASVNIPRGYIVGLLRREAGPAAGATPAEPSEPDIDRRFQAERARIEASVKPHVRTRSGEGQLAEGEVQVSLIPADLPAPPPANTAGFLGPIGVGGLTLAGGMIEKIVLGVLAVCGMGAMLLMVRRAGRRADLPSPEELVGLPPALETDSDLIGEAEESDTAMAGIEVGEDEVRAQKTLEQVQDFVQSTPDTAARLVHRWMANED